MRNARYFLPSAGLSIGVAAVALVVFQPSATLAAAAGSSPARQTGSAGKTAAQVSSRLVIDNLTDPGAAPGQEPASGNPPGVSGYVTIALASLHLRAPVVRPTDVAVQATKALRPPAPALAPSPAPVPVPSPAPVPVPVAPAPVPAAPAAPAGPVTPAAPVAPSGGVWAELRECESGDNYTIDTGNGYYGAYQFSAATWQGLGYPGLPNQAAPAVQDQAAQELQARSGWGQWPECSLKLGL